MRVALNTIAVCALGLLLMCENAFAQNRNPTTKQTPKAGTTNKGTNKPSNKEPTKEADEPPSDGIQLSAPRTMDMRFGMTFYANTNYCSDMHATIAFPLDWPEQKVTLKSVDIPQNAAWEYRDLPAKVPPTARQIVMQIASMAPNAQLDMVFEVEIEKSFINPPEDPTQFVIPKKVPKEMNWYLGNSPMIETNASEVKKIVREIRDAKPENAWLHVEMICDWVQKNIVYRNGPIRRTTDALRDKSGDCEEMTGIFVALCRASNVPARCVWIPDHCYPEFYLEDAQGRGHWFPCQVAGDKQFGQMHEYRPILQKGDRFIVPEKQGPQHYVSEFFTCQKRPVGSTDPSIETILDLGPLKNELESMRTIPQPRDQE